MAEAASPALSKVRAYLSEAGLPPETALEYYIDDRDLESLKAHLLEQTRGHFHVMTRQENGRLHVIAFVNIRGIGELFQHFEEETLVQSLDQGSMATPLAGGADAEVDF